MTMPRRHNVASYALSLLILFSITACSKTVDKPPVSTGLTELPIGTAIAVGTATLTQCPTGGLSLQTFQDLNRNGILDSGEAIISTSAVCNGATGNQGIGAGVKVTAAPSGACPAGGTELTTFQDIDNNGTQDTGEGVTSVSTICNGVNSVLTSTAANSYQCLAGGTVYSTHVDGQPPSSAIICNGVNGVDGTDAGIIISAVGPAVPGHPFSACHHDALYIPDYSAANRGWLVFRHQSNGAADQGIGTTGFNVWNVDIANFNLASEVGGVNYCQLHWDPSAKRLDYTVLETTYGQGGQTGTIQY